MDGSAQVVSVMWVVLLRVTIGALWLRSGLLKIPSRRYLRYDQLLGDMIHGNPIGWYAAFLRSWILPYNRPAGYVFVTAEVVIGLALILGLLTVPVALLGAFLNLNFRLGAGAQHPSVTPLNYLFIVCQLVIVFSGAGNYLSLDALLFR